MENCLVTKLKGSVDNNTLPTLGSVIFDASAGNSNFIWNTNLPVGTEIVCNILGDDGYFTDSTYTENYGKSITITLGTLEEAYIRCYVKSQNGCRVDVCGIPYGHTTHHLEFKDCFTDLENLLQYRNIRFIDNRNLTVSGAYPYDLDLSKIAHPELFGRFKLERAPNVVGNVNIFANSELIGLSIWGNTKITGNLSAFSECFSLKIISVGGHVSGTLEELAVALASNGVARTIQIWIAGSDQATFGGKRMMYVGGRYGSDDSNVVIAAANDIKVYDNRATRTLLGEYNGSAWTYYAGYEA